MIKSVSGWHLSFCIKMAFWVVNWPIISYSNGLWLSQGLNFVQYASYIFYSQYVLHMCHSVQKEPYGKGLRPCPKEISV